MIIPALTPDQTSLKLQTIPAWFAGAQTISRIFKFDAFLTSIAFVRRVAKRAEKNQHHPDIEVRYDKVTLSFTTQREGGLTDKDFTLARQCDEIFAKLSAA